MTDDRPVLFPILISNAYGTKGDRILVDTAELYEIMHPQKSALVIWDVQKTLVDRIFNKEGLLANTKAVIDLSRKKKYKFFY